MKPPQTFWISIVSIELNLCLKKVAFLRAQHSKPFALVTPGIRPHGSAVGDQVRVMTPSDAIAAGASQLVIGRPITQSEDPTGAFAQCCAGLTT